MAAIDEKYEDEVYRNLMKSFAASAASGDLTGLEKGPAEVFLCTVLHHLVQVLLIFGASFLFCFFFGSSFLVFFCISLVFSSTTPPVPFPITMITFQCQSPDAPHLVARLLKNSSTRLFEFKSSN